MTFRFAKRPAFAVIGRAKVANRQTNSLHIVGRRTRGLETQSKVLMRFCRVDRHGIFVRREVSCAHRTEPHRRSWLFDFDCPHDGKKRGPIWQTHLFRLGNELPTY